MASGPSAGFGHISRCANLAVCLLEFAGITSSTCHLDGEIEAVERIFGDLRPELLIIDVKENEAVANLARLARRNGSKLVIISDHPPEVEADLVICPGPHGYSWPLSFHSGHLLGIEYALVSEIFSPARFLGAGSRQILLNLGGSVATTEVLDLARNLESGGLKGIIVSPSFEPSCSCYVSEGFSLREGVSSDEIKFLALSCELTVTSCGLASLEMLSLGVPLAVVSLNALQEQIATWYQENLGVANLGNFSTKSLGRVAEAIRASCGQQPPKSMPEIAAGCRRVAIEILDLVGH